MGRSVTMKIICCVCKRVRRGDAWLAIEPEPGALASHGFCPECGRAEMEKVEAEQKREAEAKKTEAEKFFEDCV